MLIRTDIQCVWVKDSYSTVCKSEKRENYYMSVSLNIVTHSIVMTLIHYKLHSQPPRNMKNYFHSVRPNKLLLDLKL